MKPSTQRSEKIYGVTAASKKQKPQCDADTSDKTKEERFELSRSNAAFICLKLKCSQTTSESQMVNAQRTWRTAIMVQGDNDRQTRKQRSSDMQQERQEMSQVDRSGVSYGQTAKPVEQQQERCYRRPARERKKRRNTGETGRIDAN